MPLDPDGGWLPRLDRIPPAICARARLMYLNYPNNPTGACAPMSFYEEAVAFARQHQILIAHDAAYAETYFESPPPSILQIAGAKDLCIELHSLSKTFNMTGWRVGFACGDREMVAALVKVKSNLDSGIFGAVQEAGIEALQGIHRPEIKTQLGIYKKRRDILVQGLRDAGWKVEPPPATFYLWVKCPLGHTSMEASARLLAEAGVVAVPGEGFGACGSGYLRFALTVDERRTSEAVARIAKLRW
jgi:LL-diaminopimelate aminotransferase